VRYLSNDWFSAADTALNALAPAPSNARVGFIITGGPDGDIRYNLRLGAESVGIDTEPTPDVALTLPWSLAVAIATGEASAQRAVLDGEIRISGDVRVLLGNNDTLGVIDDKLAGLRSETVFS